MSSRPKLLIIALGEAAPDLIASWADAGRLPTFARLRAHGATGLLRSQLPLITPQMWGTIITGKTPGRHGAFDFWQRGADGRFREINGGALYEPPLWRVLGDRGLACGIVNVPFTFPPQRINGFMIAGQDAPGAHRAIAQPPEVYDELVRRFGRYHLKDIFPGGRKKTDYLTLIEDEVTRQTTALEHLLTTRSWDLFFTFFSATAMAQHYFWSDMESADPQNPFRGVIEATYRSLDAAVARLMAAAGPDAIVCVFSECGAGRLQSGIQINAWLSHEGFLAWKRPPETNGASDCGGAGKGSSPLKRAIAGVMKRAKRAVPPSMFYWANVATQGVRGQLESYLADSGIAWERTQAFSRGKEGDIFINLKGRDPRGIVAPGAEYDAVCARITERLMALVDPETGQRPVTRVYRAKELYAGPWEASAPDLTVAWKGCVYMPTEDEGDRKTVFVPRQRQHMDWPTTGSHRMDGLLAFAGPGIANGSAVTGARLIDLFPTWLSLLGQPVPDGLGGRVIEGLRA